MKLTKQESDGGSKLVECLHPLSPASLVLPHKLAMKTEFYKVIIRMTSHFDVGVNLTGFTIVSGHRLESKSQGEELENLFHFLRPCNGTCLGTSAIPLGLGV